MRSTSKIDCCLYYGGTITDDHCSYCGKSDYFGDWRDKTELIIHHRDFYCEIDFNIPLEETTVEFKLFEYFIKRL